LFSYCTRSHSTLNYTFPWSGPPLSHDQTLNWSSFHCHGGSFVLIHRSWLIMLLNLWCFSNTFIPPPIWNYNQGWMWNSNPQHYMHFGLTPHWIVFQLDVANAFNSMLRHVIFQKLCVANGDII
jgi:hypothetical protein